MYDANDEYVYSGTDVLINKLNIRDSEILMRNGRTQRAFLEVLAENAEHPIDLRRITPEIWHQASVLGFHKGNYKPMHDLIATALMQ